MPRLTLTRRAEENRASCAIDAEPMQPEPPVPVCACPAGMPPGRAPAGRCLSRTAPGTCRTLLRLRLAGEQCLRQASQALPLCGRQGCVPRGIASCISAMVSAAICTMLSIESASRCPGPGQHYFHKCPVYSRHPDRACTYTLIGGTGTVSPPITQLPSRVGGGGGEQIARLRYMNARHPRRLIRRTPARQSPTPSPWDGERHELPYSVHSGPHFWPACVRGPARGGKLKTETEA